ncbi:hypothetical protein MMC14_008041 [Varicellaria rhodocarpa]|nr:hypothetical protein [Varicellaria rhodocarpa]
MNDSRGPRNRKERRVAGIKYENSGSSNIPLEKPSRDPPTAKTLFEIAAERQTRLQGGEPFAKNKDSSATTTTTQINADGTLSDISPQGESQIVDDPIGPLGHAIVYALTLTMLHFTLDVLVHHQYRQEIGWLLILQRTIVTFPILLALLYMLHAQSSNLWAQMMFFGMSVGAGCYLVYSSNELAYFAVMKRAPPLGTLWIWSVVEMRLPFAMGSIIAVGGYFWWGGYTIF